MNELHSPSCYKGEIYYKHVWFIKLVFGAFGSVLMTEMTLFYIKMCHYLILKTCVTQLTFFYHRKQLYVSKNLFITIITFFSTKALNYLKCHVPRSVTNIKKSKNFLCCFLLLHVFTYNIMHMLFFPPQILSQVKK